MNLQMNHTEIVHFGDFEIASVVNRRRNREYVTLNLS